MIPLGFSRIRTRHVEVRTLSRVAIDLVVHATRDRQHLLHDDHTSLAGVCPLQPTVVATPHLSSKTCHRIIPCPIGMDILWKAGVNDYLLWRVKVPNQEAIPGAMRWLDSKRGVAKATPWQLGRVALNCQSP